MNGTAICWTQGRGELLYFVGWQPDSNPTEIPASEIGFASGFASAGVDDLAPDTVSLQPETGNLISETPDPA